MEGRRALLLSFGCHALLYAPDLDRPDLFCRSIPASHALRDSASDRGFAQARDALDRDSFPDRDDDVWLGGARLFRAVQNTRKRDGGLRRRQAVDVEDTALHRPARDQRTA